MEVVDIDRNIIGTIINLYNYGAGDIVEIEFNNKQKELFPFVDEYFPEIDLKIRKVLFIRPQYI
jgi:16S rRNA processing protein RimM